MLAAALQEWSARRAAKSMACSESTAWLGARGFPSRRCHTRSTAMTPPYVASKSAIAASAAATAPSGPPLEPSPPSSSSQAAAAVGKPPSEGCALPAPPRSLGDRKSVV